MSRTPFVADPDFTLYVGDALTVLRGLPDESVHCCVTSPPYWGLRDYGTPGQLGLEATPDLFVAAIVAVFREVRRVLRGDGTLWLNLGDSYAQTGGRSDRKETRNDTEIRDEADSGRIGGVETGAQARPDDLGARAGGGDIFLGSDGGVRGGGGRTGHGGAGVVGRAHEFKDRGDSRGYAPGSNWSNYGSRIGEARDSAVGGLKPKDLCGIPWRVAFALQADGWYLRSDIIWSKPNPMPESVTDRPTKAHEYLFLLSKSPRYFFDQEAVREAYQPSSLERERYGHNNAYGSQFAGSPTDTRSGKTLAPGEINSKARGPDGRRTTKVEGRDGSLQHRDGERWPNGGRNLRSVWEIATQPYPDAHFATFPEALPERCIRAGTSERGCCPECGAAWVREVERSREYDHTTTQPSHDGSPYKAQDAGGIRNGVYVISQTTGWLPGCTHADGVGVRNPFPPVPCTVLDPFLGSGTTALVARKLGRRTIGIELSPEYAQLAARRLQQLSLLADVPA